MVPVDYEKEIRVRGNMETIPFLIELDGQTHEFPPFFIVLACALKGFDWAIKKCENPEFDKMVRTWFLEQRAVDAQEEVEYARKNLEETETQYKEIQKKIAALKN